MPKNGLQIVPCAGARKNFANATRVASRSRRGAGAKMRPTNRVGKMTTACSNQIAIGCGGIATASQTSGNGARGAVGASRARAIAIAGIRFATVKPTKRRRNMLRRAMSCLKGVAIATNVRGNGNRATKQNGVLATGTEISSALTLRRGAIATAPSTIPIG